MSNRCLILLQYCLVHLQSAWLVCTGFGVCGIFRFLLIKSINQNLVFSFAASIFHFPPAFAECSFTCRHPNRPSALGRRNILHPVIFFPLIGGRAQMLLLAVFEEFSFPFFPFLLLAANLMITRAFWGSCGLRPRQTHLVLPFVPSSSFALTASG